VGKTYADNFNRANGAVGSIPGGPAWETISGTPPTIVSNQLAFSDYASAEPKAVVPLGARMNGSCDVDVSVTPDNTYGCCLYVRLVDYQNYLRLRLYSDYTTYQYYQTEYEWNDLRWRDSYSKGYIEHYWSFTSNPSWTMGTWSAWQTNSTTVCRVSAPAPFADVYGSSGNVIKQYRDVQRPGSECTGGQAGQYKYDRQSRTRSETYTPGSTTYQWSQTSPGSGWVDTGATRVVYPNSAPGDLYFTVSTNSSDTNPGQSTTPDNSIDKYVATAAYTYTTYWSPYGDVNSYGPPDTQTGNSRQGGPYTGYTYYYGRLSLEKCVGGTTTNLGGVYTSGSTSPKVMRVVAKGASLTAYYDGVQRITVTDSTFQTTGTKTGLGGGPAPAGSYQPKFDDFSVSVLTPFKVRNADDTAWIDVPFPKFKVGSAWVEIDPQRR
jgi:hypothetical protein